MDITHYYSYCISRTKVALLVDYFPKFYILFEEKGLFSLYLAHLTWVDAFKREFDKKNIEPCLISDNEKITAASLVKHFIIGFFRDPTGQKEPLFMITGPIHWFVE